MESKIDHIKKLIIKSLFADDDLMDLFVLKGGNALAYGYNLSNRSSLDVDVSMEYDFEFPIEEIQNKIEIAFNKVFGLTEYRVFDFKLEPKPKKLSEYKEKFWGGYKLDFKIINNKDFDLNKLHLSRKKAISLGEKGSKPFKVDISKFEYTQGKEEIEFEGFYISIYTPIMIVNEKLRAICQQMPEYKIQTNKKPRPRDFFDIYNIFENIITDISNFTNDENKENLRKIFEIKKVPIELLGSIENTLEFHQIDKDSLFDSIPVKEDIKDFEFYFNYVVNKVKLLDSFWIK